MPPFDFKLMTFTISDHLKAYFQKVKTPKADRN